MRPKYDGMTAWQIEMLKAASRRLVAEMRADPPPTRTFPPYKDGPLPGPGRPSGALPLPPLTAREELALRLYSTAGDLHEIGRPHGLTPADIHSGVNKARVKGYQVPSRVHLQEGPRCLH